MTTDQLAALTDADLVEELRRLSDGSQDATATVQEAFNRGARALPPGTYRVTGPVSVPFAPDRSETP